MINISAMSVISLTIIFCNCLFGNSIYVSVDGTDNVECGASSGLSACRSVVYACKKQETYPQEIAVATGNYIETDGLDVKGIITIKGDQIYLPTCSLSKLERGSFVLFTLATNGASLTLSNLTVVLTVHSPTANFIRCMGEHAAVTVAFCSCGITMRPLEGLSSICGMSIYIDNSLAQLTFNDCIVYNISTSDIYFPFTYCLQLSTLNITSSYFLNIFALSDDAGGSCFYLTSVANFSITQSVFVLCRIDVYAYGGVGNIGCLTDSGSVVRGCTVQNCSCFDRGGMLHVQSMMYFTPTLLFENCTFVRCNAPYGGTLYTGSFVYTTMHECTFLKTSSANNGSVVYLDYYCTLVMSRCVIAYHSGFSSNYSLIYMGRNSNVSLVKTLFFNNGNLTNVMIQNNSNSVLTTELSFSDYGRSIPTDSDAVSCAATFDALSPENDVCTMPCAAYGSTCVKPKLCPNSTLPSFGMCIPSCVFALPFVASPSGASTHISCPFLDNWGEGADLSRLTCGMAEEYAYAYRRCALRCQGTPEHYAGGRQCIIKPCSERTALLTSSDSNSSDSDNSSDSSSDVQTPCADNTKCFYDVGNTEAPLSCSHTCTKDRWYVSNVTSGVCEVRACKDRLNVAGEAHPCMDNSVCFYDPQATQQVRGRLCVESCATNTRNTGEVVDGVCVAKKTGGGEEDGGEGEDDGTTEEKGLTSDQIGTVVGGIVGGVVGGVLIVVVIVVIVSVVMARKKREGGARSNSFD